MSNYFQMVPLELVNLICLYLDSTGALIFEYEFDLSINHEFLLSQKYPAFHDIIKYLKKNDIKYRNYPYARAYDEISLFEKILQYDNAQELQFLRSKNMDDFSRLVFDQYFETDEVANIVEAYYTVKRGYSDTKYRKYFPNFPGSDILFIKTISNFRDDVSLNKYIFDYDNSYYIEMPLEQLCSIYLYMLKGLTITSSQREELLNLNRPEYDYKITNNEKIMLQYIKEYLINQKF